MSSDRTAPIKKSNWRRHALLAFSIGLTALGIGLGFFSSSSNASFAKGVCLKTGIVLFMWWLALPQLQRLNPWALGIAGTVAVALIVRPSLLRAVAQPLIPFIPLMIGAWFLWRLLRKSNA